MQKKAIITIKLVPEASEVANEKAEKEIRKEAQIPWCKEIEKVIIEEVEDCYKQLREHGYRRM